MEGRSRVTGILAAFMALLGLAGAAEASSISMIWISTSGSALGVGTNNLIGASISDTAVLEIRWTVATPTSGIQGMGIRAQYDPSVLLATRIDVCPATANNFFGGGASPSCGGFGTNIGGPAGFIPILTYTLNKPGAPQGASAGAAGGTTPGAGQSNGSFWELARITFHVAGPGTTGGYFFEPGIDGQVPIGGGFSFPAGPVTGFRLDTGPIPEPGTFSLLALGLGLLGAATRRR